MSSYEGDSIGVQEQTVKELEGEHKRGYRP